MKFKLPPHIPAPLFRRFERVRVTTARQQLADYAGERGIVVGHDSSSILREPSRPEHWIYVVHLPVRECWMAFLQCDLESEGALDAETDHLGQRPEISFDTVVEEDNDYIEGCYRLPGEFWQVVAFSKKDVPAIVCRPSRWERPTPWEETTTGLLITIPQVDRMDRDAIFRGMAQATGVIDWVEVRGPDSTYLR